MIDTEEALDDALSEPTRPVLDAMARLQGDLLILGVAGKIGPGLARMARRALTAVRSPYQVIGVARFRDHALVRSLEQAGITTLAADLSDADALNSLPPAKHVIYLAGRKFGTSGQEHRTWAINTHLAARVAEIYRDSQLVAFSTGNVYPLSPAVTGGCVESDPPAPVGEYAQSCLGRERLFEHFSHRYGTPGILLRLNYAVELRYGVLHEIASAVFTGEPIDVTTGAVNVIWQGDVNAATLRSFEHCSSPTRVLNLTGPETVSVRWLGQRFADLFDTDLVITGEEASTALLSNASIAHRLFGYPSVPLGLLIEWTADWVRKGGPSLAKPTHFQQRQGRF